jgi:hypothetical protein
MSRVITQDNLFRPVRSKAETKAEITDQTARSIVGAEAERRDAKTARLRKARLASEAQAVPDEKPAKPRAKKAAPRRSK